MAKCKLAPTPMIVNERLLKDDNIEKENPTLYRKLLGSLIYLTNIRANIAYAISILS